jgi:DNA-binding NarL/FixJ family response regulator
MLDPALTMAVLERLRKPPAEDPRYATLSEQERKVLELVADGLTNKQIASELFVAEKTVKNYVSSMLRKLGMVRRTEAAVFAVQLRQGEQPDY